jgi:hypothetical protein
MIAPHREGDMIGLLMLGQASVAIDEDNWIAKCMSVRVSEQIECRG